MSQWTIRSRLLAIYPKGDRRWFSRHYEKPARSTKLAPTGASTMKALVYQAIGQKALLDCPKPEIAAPTDAIVRITKTTICGTDLHILKGDLPSCQPGRILGHEGVGIIDQRRRRPSRHSSRAIGC